MRTSRGVSASLRDPLPPASAVLSCLLLIATGCGSTRFTTDIDLAARHSRPDTARFRIEGIEVIAPDAPAASDFTFPADLFDARVVMASAVRICPEVFARRTNAIPVYVKVDLRQESDFGRAMLLQIATLCLINGVFPYPFGQRVDATLTCELLESRLPDGSRTLFSDESYHTEDVSWVTVFTPFGLIPVPGRSDVPKASYALGGAGRTERLQRERQREMLVHALARRLGGLDVSALRTDK